MARDYDAMISYTRQQGAAVAQRVFDLLKGGGFKIWQDTTHMRGGNDFWRQIEAAIERAHYLIMALTPDAFEGDRRVLRDEWLTARRRGCHVLPVYEENAIDFSNPTMPAWLKKLDCYNLGNPNHCAKLVNDLRTTPNERRIIPSDVEFPPGFVFVPREAEMRDIVAALIDDGEGERVALMTALRGAGGFGKTTLAKAVCQDNDVLERYSDGVLWLTVGEGHRTVEQLLSALLEQLGQKPRSTDADALLGQWKEALRTRQCLVVLDDVWKESDVRALVVGETSSAFLITTRIPRVTSAIEARDCLVDEMTPAQSQSVLAAALGTASRGYEVRLTALAEKAGNWPVLLGLIVDQLRLSLRRSGASPERAIERIEERLRDVSLTAFDHPDPNRRSAAIATTIEVSLRYLTENTQQAATHYRELAVFPDDVPIPLAVLQDLWAVSNSDAYRIAEDFDDAGLAILDEQRGLIVHDVFLEYMRRVCKKEERVALHRRLLAAWPEMQALPHAYAWRWFSWHCLEAGEGSRLTAALLDLDWLAMRLAKTDLASLLADCQHARQSGVASQRAIVLLQDVLEKSAHVLLAAPEQLPTQLLGRVRPNLFPELSPLIAQVKEHLATHALRPLTQNLHPIGSALRRTLQGHDTRVDGALALAGGRVLSWGRENTLRLWSATGEPLTLLRGHEDWIYGALELTDGRLLSWSEDSTLRLWAATGEPLTVMRSHETWSTGALELADGRLLSWSWNTLYLWSTRGDLLTVLSGHGDFVYGALLLSGGRLLSWSRDRTLRLWSATGEPIAVLCGHDSWVKGALALADGRLVSWADDSTLRLWSATGEPLTLLHGHDSAVTGALALADGYLVSWGNDSTLRLWSATGEPLAELRGHESSVTGALAIAGGRLLSWSWDKTLRLWSATGEPLAVLRGHESSVTGALALADGCLLSWSSDSTLRLWSATGEPLAVLRGHVGPVYGALALADGCLLSWSEDRTLRLWWAMDEPLGMLLGHEGSVRDALALSNGHLLSWSSDNTLRQWSATGKALAVLQGHKSSVRGAMALPNGLLLSWSLDNTLRLWTVTGNLFAILRGHEDSVTGALALSNGRLLSWSSDKTLRQWSATGKALAVLRGHEFFITGALALADTRLLSSSGDGTLRLWSATGEPLAVLRGHEPGSVDALALVDGRLLSWSWDKTLRLWSATGEPLALLTGHEDHVNGAHALNNGQLLSWSEDSTLRLWSPTGELLAVLSGHEKSVNGALALADGRLLSWSEDGTLRLWSTTGESLAVLRGHEDGINGALSFLDGRLLSWSKDGTLRRWSYDGQPQDSLYFDAAITVTLPFADRQLFIGDALGGIHIVTTS